MKTAMGHRIGSFALAAGAPWLGIFLHWSLGLAAVVAGFWLGWRIADIEVPLT